MLGWNASLEGLEAIATSVSRERAWAETRSANLQQLQHYSNTRLWYEQC